ncbi:MAG: N-acetyltransferase [Dehalococcoidia bacterium]|nr:N-acetyltransferase [Dehalococcoidia bacterium]
MTAPPILRVERATAVDIDAITALINSMAFSKDGGDLLPRSRDSVANAIPDFYAVHEGSELVGCVAIQNMGSKLAEVRSLAVVPGMQGRGVGRLLVDACIEEAHERGLNTLFALTRKPVFFERFGFHEVEVVNFPKKVWQDCYVCPRFIECDEVALVLEIEDPDDDAY